MARTKAPIEVGLRRALETLAASRDRHPASLGAEDVAAHIQELVIRGKIQEGSRLPSERDLAEMLGISRPTVSQAIRILVVRGLVDARRGSGAYVRWRPQEGLSSSVHLMLGLDSGSVEHLADMRLWLESTGMERAIEHATDADIADAADALDRFSSASGDVAAWLSADSAFHSTIVGASRNPYLSSIYESVHTTLIKYEYRSWIDSGAKPPWLVGREMDALLELHVPILDALETRNHEAGQRAVLHHHEEMTRHLRSLNVPQ